MADWHVAQYWSWRSCDATALQTMQLLSMVDVRAEQRRTKVNSCDNCVFVMGLRLPCVRASAEYPGKPRHVGWAESVVPRIFALWQRCIQIQKKSLFLKHDVLITHPPFVSSSPSILLVGTLVWRVVLPFARVQSATSLPSHLSRRAPPRTKRHLE
jgi:hypothetical protein